MSKDNCTCTGNGEEVAAFDPSELLANNLKAIINYAAYRRDVGGAFDVDCFYSRVEEAMVAVFKIGKKSVKVECVRLLNGSFSFNSVVGIFEADNRKNNLADIQR